jgi:hypothetical protein
MEAMANAARRREPVGLEREQQDEQDAEKEHGCGLAEERHAHRDVVEQRVALDGGEQADGHRHHQREAECRERQFGAGRQVAHHHSPGRLAEVDRAAEVAAQETAQEHRVLHGQGPVEA